MQRLGAIEREEVKSLILVCRARGYNSKQILSVVNDNLRKHNDRISEKAVFNILAKTKKDAQEWLRNLINCLILFTSIRQVYFQRFLFSESVLRIVD